MTKSNDATTAGLIKANLIITGAMIFFSLSLPLMEALGTRYSVMGLVVLRNIIAGLFLIAIGLVLERGQALSRSGLRHAIFSGATYYILSIVCLFYAVTITGAFAAAIILSMVPVISALLDLIGGYGRIGPRLIVSIILSLVGGVLASVDFNQDTFSFALAFGWGELILLLGVLTWVLLSRYVNTHMTEEPPYKGIGVVMLAPGLLLIPFVAGMQYFGIEDTRIISAHAWHMPLFDIGLLLALAMVASAGSMALWFKGSSILGTTIASLQQNLVPFFVLIQVWWLGQVPHYMQVLGGVLVVFGALIAQMRELRPRKLPPADTAQ